MLLTRLLRLFMGLVWLIALLAATLVALPVLLVLGGFVLIWKIGLFVQIVFSNPHQKAQVY